MITALLCTLALSGIPTYDIPVKMRLESVATDADDAAIWVCPANPAMSLLFGNDKEATPGGGLYVYGLDGKIRQKIEDIDRPNNIDVEYGLKLGGRTIDLLVCTERLKHRLRVFAIDPRTRTVRDVSGNTNVFEGDKGKDREPMGISLYRRPKDGAVFAFVSRKSGPKNGYLGVYRLVPNGGKVDCRYVAKVGRFSGDGEIEAIVVDDEEGTVYYADENYAIREIVADPDAKDFGKQISEFGYRHYQGDREGLAIYGMGGRKGYLLSSNQVKGASEVLVYDRRSPHALLARLRLGADETDGLDCTSKPLPDYPKGLLVVMNSEGRNYFVADFRDVLSALGVSKSAKR